MGFFDHCQPYQRFGNFTADIWPRGPTTWHTIDWDQRRYISTSVPKEVDTEYEDKTQIIYQALAKVVDGLEDDVHLVNFSMNGEFISTSSDPADDTTRIPLYCPIDMIPKKYRTGRVISRTDLVEVDRLKDCVDLVMYRWQPGSRGVFKYNFYPDRARRNWHELNCWLRLSEHPSIVPFEYIVTDFEDVPGHGTHIEVVVGFTTTFIPGKTLAENRSRVFKLKYLEQLIEVIDDLHLKFGIVQHDIHPGNILINPETDSLQLFDFGISGRLGWKDDQGDFNSIGSFKSDLNHVVATVYEVITGDREGALQIFVHGRDISTITKSKWVKHPDVSLDSDVSSYQRTLRCWLRQRWSRPYNQITHFSQAQSPLELWPHPWRLEIPHVDRDGNPITLSWGPHFTSSIDRTEFRVQGLKFVEWERPAHNKIPEGFCVVADGTLVAKADLDGYA